MNHTRLVILIAVFALCLLWAPVLHAQTTDEPATAVLVVTAGGDHDYPPYEFLDHGTPAGFNVDLIRAVARVMGLDLKLTLGPWNEMRRKLEAGEIDMITGMYYSRQRDRVVDFSMPFLIVSYAAFVRDGSPYRSFDDIAGKNIVVQSGDVAHDLLRGMKLTPSLSAIPDMSDVLRTLAAGRFDAAVLPRLQGRYFTAKYNLTNLRALDSDLPPQQYCFGVREGYDILRMKLDEGLGIVKATGEYREIYSRWFGEMEVWNGIRIARVTALVLVPFFALLFVIYWWFRSLRRQVQARTAELEMELFERRRAESALKESEIKYRALIDNAEEGIAVSVDQRFRFVNPALVRQLGYQPEELLGAACRDFVHPNDRAPFARRHLAAKAAGSDEVAVRFRGRDGAYRVMRVTGAPIVWEGVPAILDLFTDVTKEKSVENELRASEENLAITLNSIGDGVIATDVRGRVLRMNPAAERLTGWMAEEARDLPLTRIFHLLDPTTRESIDDPVTRVIESGATGEMSRPALLVTKDGAELMVADSAAPIRNRQESVVGVVLVFRDVTTRQRIDEQVRQAQKMQAIGQLAGGIAHDFNNLLTGIRGNVSLVLADASLSPALRDTLGQIDASVGRAVDLIHELLTFSRRQMVAAEPLDVNEVLRGGLAGMFQRLLGEDIRVHLELAPDAGHIRADRGQLEQLVINLVMNAREAMPSGGDLTIATTVVTVEDPSGGNEGAPRAGRFVEIAVSDTGRGMDERTRAKAFEPFFSTKPLGQGAGLGLSVAYGIAQRHDGEILMESTPGQGTTVRVRLPREEAAVEAAAAPRAPVGDVGGSETILLVEDDGLVRDVTLNMLNHLGYKVHAAPDGETGLAFASDLGVAIDLLLTDVVLPGINGRRLAEEIAHDRPTLKVLFTSGYTDDVVVRHGVANDNVNFLPKPYTLRELARKVRAILDATTTAI